MSTLPTTSNYSNLGEAEAGSPALTPSPSRQPPSVLEVNGVAAGSRWNSEISEATDSEFSEAAPRLTAHEMALQVTACTFVMTPRERCQRNGTAFASYNGVTWWSFYKSQSKLPLSAQKRTMSRSLVFLLVLVIIVILALAVCIPTFWIENNRNKQNSTIRPFEQTTRDIGT
ncbi:hypothetical protein LSAT2_025297 [Lamellibrachia satsuma]|nr:hypothetical protein LSAT2_025297 [Lamellibrachia satsuma]